MDFMAVTEVQKMFWFEVYSHLKAIAFTAVERDAKF